MLKVHCDATQFANGVCKLVVIVYFTLHLLKNGSISDNDEKK